MITRNGLDQYFFVGIDKNRTLAQNVNSYAATEDCFAFVTCNANTWGLVYIDGLLIMVLNPFGGTWTLPLGQIKKGQKVTSSDCYLMIYGVKK